MVHVMGDDDYLRLFMSFWLLIFSSILC